MTISFLPDKYTSFNNASETFTQTLLSLYSGIKSNDVQGKTEQALLCCLLWTDNTGGQMQL